jgi:phosphatidylinositol 4-kinase
MKFESANFKLTEEMIKIMGGSIHSEPFSLYLNLVIKAFLVVRKYQEHIYNTVKQMVKSGLPCFLPQSLENLRGRFMLHLNDLEAAHYMKKVVYDAADKWTTNWYDRIQWIQQRIYH